MAGGPIIPVPSGFAGNNSVVLMRVRLSPSCCRLGDDQFVRSNWRSPPRALSALVVDVHSHVPKFPVTRIWPRAVS